MPPRCTVCDHPDLARIDSALLGNESMRAIASRFGLNKSAVQRHSENHLPALLVKAHEAATIAQADTLLEQVQRAQTRVLGWLDAAEKDKDRKSLAPLSKELRGYLGLMGQLTGQLSNGVAVNVNTVNMGSPAVGAASDPELSITQLAEVLASLPPDDLRAALELAREIHAANEQAEAIAESALRRPQVLPGSVGATAPANLFPLEPSAATTPAQSLYQPSRSPGT